jgi:hypothetical protein
MVENTHSSWSDSFGTETFFIVSVKYIPVSWDRSNYIMQHMDTHNINFFVTS